MAQPGEEGSARRVGGWGNELSGEADRTESHQWEDERYDQRYVGEFQGSWRAGAPKGMFKEHRKQEGFRIDVFGVQKW